MLKYIVKRGKEAGLEMYPHMHKDGKYVASKTRFKEDHTKTDSLVQLEQLVKKGYKIGMSPKGMPGRATSLVNPVIS